MAGLTQTKWQKTIIKSFNVMNNNPLDSRTTITQLSDIDAELPIAQRYIGLQIHVKDVDRMYHFLGGVNNSDLKKVAMITTVEPGDTITYDESNPNDWSWAHNLSAELLQITAIIGGQTVPILVKFSSDEDTNVRFNNVIINFDQYFTASGETSISNMTLLVTY